MRLIVTWYWRPWYGLGLIWRYKQVVYSHDNPDLDATRELIRRFREAGADVRVEGDD